MLSMTTFFLNPVVSRNKSYYKKAKVIEFKGVKYLKSYDTIVCAITAENEFIRLWGGYSATTKNHINDFCALYGFETMNKKTWENMDVKSFPVPVEVLKVPMAYKADYYSDIYNPYI